MEDDNKCVGSDIWFNSTVYFNFHYASRRPNDKPQRVGGLFNVIRHEHNWFVKSSGNYRLRVLFYLFFFIIIIPIIFIINASFGELIFDINSLLNRLLFTYWFAIIHLVDNISQNEKKIIFISWKIFAIWIDTYKVTSDNIWWQNIVSSSTLFLQFVYFYFVKILK